MLSHIGPPEWRGARTLEIGAVSLRGSITKWASETTASFKGTQKKTYYETLHIYQDICVWNENSLLLMMVTELFKEQILFLDMTLTCICQVDFHWQVDNSWTDNIR